MWNYNGKHDSCSDYCKQRVFEASVFGTFLFAPRNVLRRPTTTLREDNMRCAWALHLNEFTTSLAVCGCLAFWLDSVEVSNHCLSMLWRIMPFRVNQRMISAWWKSVLSFLVYASTIVSEVFHCSLGDKLRCIEDVWDVFRMRSCQVCVVHEPFLVVKGCFFVNRATAYAFGPIWEALIAWSRFCLISEAVFSSHSTAPYITGRGLSRFHSKSRRITIRPNKLHVPASTIVSQGFYFSSGDKQWCTEDDWDVFRMRSCQNATFLAGWRQRLVKTYSWCD